MCYIPLIDLNVNEMVTYAKIVGRDLSRLFLLLRGLCSVKLVDMANKKYA